MGYKQVNDLSADLTISLGGRNKKTGKNNPTQVEGYYLGSRSVADNKKKSGISYIYFFKTKTGNIGVWGKTDIDRKMGSVTPGVMTRVTHTGMVDTPNGEMYKYSVEFDEDNTIEVVGSESVEEEAVSSVEEREDELGSEELEALGDEEELSLAAVTAAAERANKVKALLGNRKKN